MLGALGGAGTGKKTKENGEEANGRIKESGQWTRGFSLPPPSDLRVRMASIPAYLSTQV